MYPAAGNSWYGGESSPPPPAAALAAASWQMYQQRWQQQQQQQATQPEWNVPAGYPRHYPGGYPAGGPPPASGIEAVHVGDNHARGRQSESSVFADRVAGGIRSYPHGSYSQPMDGSSYYYDDAAPHAGSAYYPQQLAASGDHSHTGGGAEAGGPSPRMLLAAQQATNNGGGGQFGYFPQSYSPAALAAALVASGASGLAIAAAQQQQTQIAAAYHQHAMTLMGATAPPTHATSTSTSNECALDTTTSARGGGGYGAAYVPFRESAGGHAAPLYFPPSSHSRGMDQYVQQPRPSSNNWQNAGPPGSKGARGGTSSAASSTNASPPTSVLPGSSMRGDHRSASSTSSVAASPPPVCVSEVISLFRHGGHSDPTQYDYLRIGDVRIGSESSRDRDAIGERRSRSAPAAAHFLEHGSAASLTPRTISAAASEDVFVSPPTPTENDTIRSMLSRPPTRGFDFAYTWAMFSIQAGAGVARAALSATRSDAAITDALPTCSNEGKHDAPPSASSSASPATSGVTLLGHVRDEASFTSAWNRLRPDRMTEPRSGVRCWRVKPNHPSPANLRGGEPSVGLSPNTVPLPPTVAVTVMGIPMHSPSLDAGTVTAVAASLAEQRAPVMGPAGTPLIAAPSQTTPPALSLAELLPADLLYTSAALPQVLRTVLAAVGGQKYHRRVLFSKVLLATLGDAEFELAGWTVVGVEIMLTEESCTSHRRKDGQNAHRRQESNSSSATNSTTAGHGPTSLSRSTPTSFTRNKLETLFLNVSLFYAPRHGRAGAWSTVPALFDGFATAYGSPPSDNDDDDPTHSPTLEGEVALRLAVGLDEFARQLTVVESNATRRSRRRQLQTGDVPAAHPGSSGGSPVITSLSEALVSLLGAQYWLARRPVFHSSDIPDLHVTRVQPMDTFTTAFAAVNRNFVPSLVTRTADTPLSSQHADLTFAYLDTAFDMERTAELKKLAGLPAGSTPQTPPPIVDRRLAPLATSSSSLSSSVRTVNVSIDVNGKQREVQPAVEVGGSLLAVGDSAAPIPLRSPTAPPAARGVVVTTAPPPAVVAHHAMSQGREAAVAPNVAVNATPTVTATITSDDGADDNAEAELEAALAAAQEAVDGLAVSMHGLCSLQVALEQRHHHRTPSGAAAASSASAAESGSLTVPSLLGERFPTAAAVMVQRCGGGGGDGHKAAAWTVPPNYATAWMKLLARQATVAACGGGGTPAAVAKVRAATQVLLVDKRSLDDAFREAALIAVTAAAPIPLERATHRQGALTSSTPPLPKPTNSAVLDGVVPVSASNSLLSPTSRGSALVSALRSVSVSAAANPMVTLSSPLPGGRSQPSQHAAASVHSNSLPNVSPVTPFDHSLTGRPLLGSTASPNDSPGSTALAVGSDEHNNGGPIQSSLSRHPPPSSSAAVTAASHHRATRALRSSSSSRGDDTTTASSSVHSRGTTAPFGSGALTAAPVISPTKGLSPTSSASSLCRPGVSLRDLISTSQQGALAAGGGSVTPPGIAVGQQSTSDEISSATRRFLPSTKATASDHHHIGRGKIVDPVQTGSFGAWVDASATPPPLATAASQSTRPPSPTVSESTAAGTREPSRLGTPSAAAASITVQCRTADAAGHKGPLERSPRSALAVVAPTGSSPSLSSGGRPSTSAGGRDSSGDASSSSTSSLHNTAAAAGAP